VNKNIATLSFIVMLTAVTILALTWGVPVNLTDNVHTDYGFPFDWGMHTTSTIAGPVDRWGVDITALVIDLVFWLRLMTVITALMLYTSKR